MTAENGSTEELETFPGGITERDASVPMFLKVTYVALVLFGILYFALYVSGDGSPLVQQLNQVTGHGVP